MVSNKGAWTCTHDRLSRKAQTITTSKIPSQMIEEFVIAALSPLTAPRDQFGSVYGPFSRAVNADSVVGKGSVHFRNVYLRHVAGGAVILTRRARLTGMIFVRLG